MREFKFKVQGSSSQYDVVIKYDNGSIWGDCSCDACRNGKYCSHRLLIFDGDFKNILSGNINDAKEVARLYKGTPLEEKRNELGITKKERDIISDRVSVLTKAVERIINNK